MPRTVHLASIAVGAIFCGAAAVGDTPSPTTSDAQRATEHARAFLEALTDDQRAAAQHEFGAAERLNWQFVPGRYPGVAFESLGIEQLRPFHALLRTTASAQGYLKITSIFRLEDELRRLESRPGRPAEHRDPGRYAIAVFGRPSNDRPWGWRVQGHHVSWNVTVVDGQINVSAPRFLGANPHELRDGPHAGLRVFAEEEDCARDLLASLDVDQRTVAVLATDAPRDVLLGPGQDPRQLAEPTGIGWRALRTEQRALLWRLVATAAHDLRDAETELARIGAAGRERLHFSWLGGERRGQGHYFRVQGPTFVLEYDNVQNDANHTHVVWHDLTDNFGGDVLRAHLRRDHR